MNFLCPNCGGTRLEEIMSDVTLSSEITAVNDGGIEYQDPPGCAGDSGRLSRYQCLNCGNTVKNANDEVINDCLELAERFKELEEARTFEISFTAQGHIEQTILIVDHNYTPAEVLEMLKKGEAVTTVQEDGDVLLVANLGDGVIAKVISSDAHLEYKMKGKGILTCP